MYNNVRIDKKWRKKVDFRERSQSAQARSAAPTHARPTTPVQNQEYPAAQPTNTPVEPKRSRRWVPVVLISTLVLASGIGFAAWKLTSSDVPAGVDTAKYQAVFLANDQVYFGNIQEITDDTLVLSNIYYLQSKSEAPATDATPGASATGQDASNPTDAAQLSLAKLGDELHGPEDLMRINMDQVLFWENLKSDGRVSSAIKDFRK